MKKLISTSPEAKEIRKNVILNTLSYLLYMLAIWAMVLITPRIGSSADAGVFTIAMSVSNICSSIAVFGIITYISSDINRKFSDTQYFYFGIATTFVSFIVALILCFAFGYHNTNMLWPTLIYYIFVSTNNTTSMMTASMIRIKKNYLFSYALIIKSAVILMLFVVFFYITKNLTIAFLVIAIFSVLYLIIVTYPILKINTGEDFKFSKTMFKTIASLVVLALPIFVYKLSFSAIVSFPKMIMEQNYSKELVGYYGSMASICTVIQSAIAPILAQFSPKFAEHFKKNNKKGFFMLAIQICTFVTAMTLVAFVCCIFLDKWLLSIIYPKDKGILEYAHFFKWIVVLNGVQAVVACLCTCLISVRKLIYTAAIAGAGLIVMFATVYLLVPRFGITGTIVCETMCYGLIGVGYLIYLIFKVFKKKENIKLSKES